MFLSWKETDRIDKIFAIIGLVDGQIDIKFLKGLINYNRPRKEIILELASHAVETGNVLENLDLAGIGWEGCDRTLPTWLVDWCTRNGEVPLLRPLVPSNEFKAVVDKPLKVVRGDNDRDIVARGQFADRIKILTSDMCLPTGKYPLVFVGVLSKYMGEINE